MMVIIKGRGFTIKRRVTPICEVFEWLNELFNNGLIGGYLVNINDGIVTITIIERG